MIDIDNKKHLSTIINSLNKDYNMSKVYGKLNPLSIYYIDIIYNLIYNCGLSVDEKQLSELITLYTKIIRNSDTICNSKIQCQKHININQNFTQSSNDDCNTIPDQNSYKIYYWQSEEIKDEISQIKLLINPTFLSTKQFDTYQNFELGKTINYSEIGRICFLDSNSNTINYEIKNELGNNITDQFDIENLPSNQTLIVSKNIMSFGDIKLKIKK